jgi:hypothetical protein
MLRPLEALGDGFGAAGVEAETASDHQSETGGGSISTRGKVCNQRRVEECNFFGRRRLEHREPSGQGISFYGWILHGPALKPLEEDIRRRGEIMQLNGGAKSSCSEPQAIPLGPSPSTPFDDYRETEREEFLTKLPLQRLDLAALFFIVKI